MSDIAAETHLYFCRHAAGRWNPSVHIKVSAHIWKKTSRETGFMLGLCYTFMLLTFPPSRLYVVGIGEAHAVDN